MSDMRNFVLRNVDGNEHGVFTGKQPRQAALKAANRGEGTKSKPEIIRPQGTRDKESARFQSVETTYQSPRK